MDAFTILHHGAVDGVTGSCHELRMGSDFGILIDCGLFQGAETSGAGAGANQLDINFPIAHIKALVVTHVHIDHVGRIPYLLAAGFKGPILCSQPSAHLLPLVLEDAVKLGFSRDPELVRSFMAELKQRVLGLPYQHWFTLLDEDGRQLRVRLQPAGHILGSAYVECDLSWNPAPRRGPPAPAAGAVLWVPPAHRVVFSGDLGAPNAPLLPNPEPPERCDTLVIESTYGDRKHPDRSTRTAQLKAIIERALANRGVVLIPAFSIGRTQELLYELESIIAAEASRAGAGELDWSQLAIIVDSPLAARFTDSYRLLKPFWDEEALATLKQGRDPLDFDQLLTIDSHQDHERLLRRLQDTHEPCVVIAASGMCAGGRIVNYLKALIGDERTDLLFVGYQARGTPGRQILEQDQPHVELDDQRYPIRAAVHQLSGYSAHADRQDLIDFVRGIPQPPGEVRIIHGEAAAKQSLARALGELLPEAKVWVP
jgi:metallo-beta-lactamase family protein